MKRILISLIIVLFIFILYSYSNITNKKDNIKIGYMFQQDALFPYLTIYENAILGLKIEKNLNTNSIKYVLNLLKKYNLLDFKDKYPNELSGGMKQRLALIRTLATKPDILLLDEPYSTLDYQTRLLVCNDVYKIIKEENITAIIVTHDIEEAVSMCLIGVITGEFLTSKSGLGYLIISFILYKIVILLIKK